MAPSEADPTTPATADSRPAWGRVVGLVVAIFGFVCASPSVAQEIVRASPDVTIPIGAAAVVTRDDQVAVDDRLGAVTADVLVGIPETAAIAAFSRVGASYAVAFETQTQLPGGLIADPADVVVYDALNAAYKIFFDGSGLPLGTRVDAVSFAGSALLLSFGERTNLGFIVDDEDVVRWDGSFYTLAFDGSAAGLDPAVDTDAVQMLGPNTLLLSFDITGAVGGIVFRDEDVMRFEDGVWSLEYQAAASEPSWIAADLDAMTVPEPTTGPLFVAGFASLAAMAARRRRRRGPVAVTCTLAIAALTLGPATGAGASEGRLEINHTCATQTGCGAGDTPGYPVTITSASRRSIVLTSNLVVPDASTTAIDILVSDVTVDLAGFSILRSGCEGATASCTDTSASNAGIRAIGSPSPSIELYGFRVYGGSAIGFSDGVVLGYASEISNVRARWNRFSGIGTIGYGGLLFDNTTLENPEFGVTTGTFGPSVAIGNRTHQNGVGLIGTGSALVLADNVGFENSVGGFSTSTSTSVFVSNTSYGNAGNGLTVSPGEAAIFEVNTVYDNTDGIFGGDGTLARGNVARNNSGIGIRLGPDGGYRENVLTNNAGGQVSSGINLGDNACSGPSGVAPCP